MNRVSTKVTAIEEFQAKVCASEFCLIWALGQHPLICLHGGSYIRIGHSDEAKSSAFLIRTFKIGLSFFSRTKIDFSNLHIDIPFLSFSNQ